jgi:hypothetical protein
MLLKGPVQQLADYMIKLSIKLHAEEWTFGLEYELWNEINGNQDFLSDSEVDKLKEMSKWCDGWIAMAHNGGTENLVFMQLEDWKSEYRANKPF